MVLIQQLFAFAHPVVLAFICPLLIVICLLLAFGEWLYPKWRIGGFIYCLSWLTMSLASQFAQLSMEELVVVGGIAAPIASGWLFVVRGLAQTLHVPSRSRLGLVRGSFIAGRSGLAKLGLSLLGAIVGAVLGLATGVLLGVVGLSLLHLLALLPAGFDQIASLPLVADLIDAAIYTFTGLGSVLGIAVGMGTLRLPQLGERLLISAVIYSAMIALQSKKLLRLPGLNRLWRRFHPLPNPIATHRLAVASHTAGRQRWQEAEPEPGSEQFEVVEQGNELTLRHRIYRSGDWVWMGFNGLYNAVAVLVGMTALIRGTWATMLWAVGLIALLGVLWTWQTLTRLCNYTTLSLNPVWLWRRESPFWSGKSSQRILLQHIATIQAVNVSPLEATPQRSRANYRVDAILVSGRVIPLIQHLERWEEALFVEARLRRFVAHNRGSA